MKSQTVSDERENMMEMALYGSKLCSPYEVLKIFLLRYIEGTVENERHDLKGNCQKPLYKQKGLKHSLSAGKQNSISNSLG